MRHLVVDRIGLTWHPSLASRILAHADRLDIIEVIPEGIFLESRNARRALRTLARSIPVAIHGVSLGLSSAEGIETRRLEAFARLVGEVQPEHWSEHLAFVRADGIELGHLAAPSRTALTMEMTAENVDRARRLVGTAPLVENVATLIEPPGSDESEAEWLRDLLDASSSDLLLDLHNLVTNGRNFGYDPRALIESLPANRIRGIHIAGGTEVTSSDGERRMLDDHRHAVPESVYALLELVGERVPHSVDVILERDGAFPPFEHLLGELDRARGALAAGRARRMIPAEPGPTDESRGDPDARRGIGSSGSARACHARFQALLARVYTDGALRERVLQDPDGEGQRAGLSPEFVAALRALDRPGLELAARSLARKRRERPDWVPGHTSPGDP